MHCMVLAFPTLKDTLNLLKDILVVGRPISVECTCTRMSERNTCQKKACLPVLVSSMAYTNSLYTPAS